MYEGEESVVLLCQLPVPAEEGVVVWGRDDLNPSIIHVRTEEGDDPTEQNKQYVNRTSIQKDALKTGDLSLTLRKPTFSDSGIYTCTVRKHGQKQNQTEVQLKVKGQCCRFPFESDQTKVTIQHYKDERLSGTVNITREDQRLRSQCRS